MKRLLLYLSACAILFCTYSCLDQIDLPIPRGLEQAIVVQAKLVKGNPHQINVQINQLYNFQISSFDNIDTRKVTLVHENGKRFELQRRGNGIYRSSIPADYPDFAIDYYTQCHLEIELQDGRTILSEPEQLLPAPKIDSISYALGQDFKVDPQNNQSAVLDTFTQFFMNIPLTTAGRTEASRFRMDLLRTYKITERRWPLVNSLKRDTCYITENTSIFSPLFIDGKTYPVDYLRDFFIYNEQIDGYFFVEGYYLTAITESLTDGAYDHFDQIKTVVNRTGNMFEAPVGEVATNFYNINDKSDPIHGYFYMTERDTLRTYVPPSFLNQDTFCLNPLFVECPYKGFQPCHPKICEDCTIQPGSTVNRPRWWKDEK